MENVQIKNQLFEIIERFKNRTAKANDVLKLAEIICYASPYPVEYFISSPENKLKIQEAVKRNFGSKDVVTAATTKEGLLEVKTIRSETYGTNIEVSNITTLNINADYVAKLQLYEVLQIIGHEMRHYFQAKAFKAIILNEEPPIKIDEDIANSMSYGIVMQNQLSELLKLTFIAKDRNFEPAVVKEYLNSSKNPQFYLNLIFNDAKYIDISSLDINILENPKASVNYFAYLQLKYEEDARIIGANFAETFLNNIFTDKLCPPAIKGFVEKSIINAQTSSMKEHKRNSNKCYKILRALYNKAIEKAINTDEADIEKLLQNLAISPILKSHIKEFRLYDMRKNNVDKSTYYKTLISYKGKVSLGNDKASFYYLMKTNPKDIIYPLLRDLNHTRQLTSLLSSLDALGNINFLVPSNPIYFTPKELSNLCYDWLKQEDYHYVQYVFGADYDNLKNIVPDLTKERFASIQKAIKTHKGINDYLNDKLSSLKEIINKKAEDVSPEEVALLKELLFKNVSDEKISRTECATAFNLSLNDYLNKLDDIQSALALSNNLKLNLIDYSEIKDKISEFDNLTKILKHCDENNNTKQILKFLSDPYEKMDDEANEI